MLSACTIIARNYQPFVRVLADSFFEHHPGASLTVLVIDDEQREFVPEVEGIEWLRLSDLGLARREIHCLAGIYDTTELATAVKPLLLRKLLDGGRATVIYLDPDIRIFDTLDALEPLIAQYGIVLTPHATDPFPKDGRRVDSFFVLAAGVYNLGFIGVGPSARAFLDWWWYVTRREALIDIEHMMFTDQRWVDFVPAFYDHHILKDPGYNVAYWNLHARDVTVAEGNRFLVNGVPLRFFHFSGFDPEKPWLLSRHQGNWPRILLSEHPTVLRLCREYLTALQAAGLDSGAPMPYGWHLLPSGVPLIKRVRRLYWQMLNGAEHGLCAEPPDPFDDQHPSAFLDWLNGPAEGGPRGVSRFLFWLYQNRPDLQQAYPDIYGDDADRYMQWVRVQGAVEESVPPELIATPEPPPVASHAVEAVELQEGLNVVGYFRAELGVGEAARQLTRALDVSAIPYSTSTYDVTLSRQAHAFQDSGNGSAYDINVLCINADATPRFARDAPREFFTGRHTVGYWFWEIEEFPATMGAAFDIVDEVWTATDFVADAVRSAGRKPVFTIPLPVPIPTYRPEITRASLDLPDRFTFLLIFDFLSVLERKNPVGVIDAFTRAFAPNEGPHLVLKSINGHFRPVDLERVRLAAYDRPDISILDTYYTAEEKNALIGACDCYVSLHRSEGFGLTMAEAMMLEKPVIATGYSGNLHFMRPDNSYLVGYERRHVPAGAEPYPTTAFWAEPDLEEASRYMREVVTQPHEAAMRARQGRLDMLARHGPEASAKAVTRRVEQIRNHRSRIAMPDNSSPEPPPVPAETLTASAAHVAEAPVKPPVDRLETVESLLPDLDKLSTLRLSADGRSMSPVRIAGQRALFRLLRPYWYQRRQFDAHLITTICQAVAAIRDESTRAQNSENRLQELAHVVEELTRHVDPQHESASRAVERLDELEQRLARIDDALSEIMLRQREQGRASGQDVASVKQGLSELLERLYAVPYMADPSVFLEPGANGRPRLGYDSSSQPATTGLYVGFEDVFRGPQESIRDRQRVYLPLLDARAPVVDIGCGRGEMLDLLAEQKVPAIGVDLDADMVALCRGKGHTVQHEDARAFLQRQPPGSLGAIFSAQVIEHLPFDGLREFLTLCRRSIRAGGLLIVETVNPHSLEAFKTFYTDLTHQRPIFPEVALALCQLIGFEQAYVMFPLGSGDLTSDRRTQGEYAVVASNGADAE